MNKTHLLLTSAWLLAGLGCAVETTEGHDPHPRDDLGLRSSQTLAIGDGNGIDDFGLRGESDDDGLVGFGGLKEPGRATEIDFDAMEASIRADLEDNVVGFAYVIAKNGQAVRSGGWGDARRNGDGNLAMTEHVPINVGSVSKPITAVATLQLLEALGMSIDDPIAPWLPPGWVQGPGIGGLTFRHLLTHRTGWNQMFLAASEAEQDLWANDWNGIAYVVSRGATPNATASYKNANYAVLRMIVPALWDASGLAPFAIDPLTEFNYGWYFVGYVQDAIFEPAGVMDSGCWDLLGTQAAYAYSFAQPGLSGVAPGNNIYHCGGHSNMVLSAADLGAFMAFIRYDDDVFSPANRMLMDEYRLGWNSLSNTNAHGRLGKFWHGGDMYLSGRDFHACVMKYPQNIEATLVLNSESPKNQCTVLKDAYNVALP